jgi:hypothetical protein
MNSFQKYNWVDVKKVASEIFCNYGYMIHWAEDAWNLLMFEKPVTEQNTIPKELTEFEEVDTLLWLIALYDLFYDYQVKIDHESGYSQYERLTDSGYEVIEVSPKDFDYFFSSIDNWEHKVAEFLKVKIYEYLLNEDFSLDKYHFNSTNKSKEKNHIEQDLTYHFIYTVLIAEIESRRSVVVEKITDIFNKNSSLILSFMAGYHYVDHYSNYKLIVKQIENSKQERLDEDPELEEYEVDEEIEDEIKNLIDEYPVSINDIQGYFDGDFDPWDVSEVYEWIDSGMWKVC